MMSRFICTSINVCCIFGRYGIYKKIQLAEVTLAVSLTSLVIAQFERQDVLFCLVLFTRYYY